MAYDGSGTFTVLYNWATEAASPPIAISKLDTEFAGIATGLSSCMLRTGGTVSGETTFSNYVTLSGTLVRHFLYETDAATNEKIWEWRASGGDLSLIAGDDARTGVTAPLVVVRTGTTIDSITFAGTTIAITGNETVSGTLAVTGASTLTGAATLSSTLAVAGNVAVATNKFTVAAASGNTLVAGTLTVGAIDVTPTSGSFTVYLRATDGGANLTSGTATWKKSNGVVTLFLPSLTATSSATDPLFIDELPAAIFPVTAAQYFLASGYDNSNVTAVQVTVGVTGNYLNIRPFTSSTFTAGSSTKGIVATTLVWTL